MNLDTAKQCVDFLANNIKKSKRSQKGTLTFFGGEPTLMWDEIIVPITNYVKQYYSNLINLSITTNGTLLDKERIDFLYTNNIIPLLSCDGSQKAQNLNRPCRTGKDSFPLVEKNLNYLLEKFPNTILRSTISHESIDEVFNTYLFGIERGFKYHFMTPNMRKPWNEKQLMQLNDQIKLIYGHMFQQFIRGKMPALSCSIVNDSFVTASKSNILVEKNISRSPWHCGLGTFSASFGYDGNIYSCQEQVSYSDGYFYIGNIFTGIDEKKHSKILQDYTQPFVHTCQNNEKCINCELSNLCNNYGCPSVNHDLTGHILISPDIECEWKKILYNNALQFFNILQTNKTFQQYLNKCGVDINGNR